jgi:fatty acid-binding protein DegV
MAETRFCDRCQKDVPRIGIHPCVRASKPVDKIEAGLKEVLEIARGNAKPAKVVVSKAAKAVKAKESKPLPNAALPTKATKSGAQRQKEWRGRNREKYNDYMRGYQSKKRAAA